MSPKKSGCCSICDTPCFEVLARWDEGPRVGEIKQMGPPNDDAVRVTFMLLNGNATDMTFCGQCAESLAADKYTLLWRRNLAGYMREQNGNPEKFKHEFSNGLLCELGRKRWKEVVNG